MWAGERVAESGCALTRVPRDGRHGAAATRQARAIALLGDVETLLRPGFHDASH